MSQPLPPDVRQALGQGNKVLAIRLLRQHTGLGLAQAKAAVEAGAVPAASSMGAHADALPAQVQAALSAGKLIEAIKLLRKARGVGLKEAKRVVDAHRSGDDAPGWDPDSGLSPGEQPRGGFGAAFRWSLFLVAALMVWIVFNAL